MAVAKVVSNYMPVQLMGFNSNGTQHPNAFTVLNIDDCNEELEVEIKGLPDGTSFQLHETSQTSDYVDRGIVILTDGKVKLKMEPRSVITGVEIK